MRLLRVDLQDASGLAMNDNDAERLLHRLESDTLTESDGKEERT